MSLLLLLSKQQITLCEGNTTQVFLNNEVGQQVLLRYLHSVHAPCDVLVNIDEDIHFETLPKLNERQQGVVLKRKLAQIFPDSPFCLAWQQNEQACFLALKEVDFCQNWFAMLPNTTPLRRVYSVSQLEQQVAAQHVHSQLLILSQMPADGLRQTYCFQKQLRFTRLSQNFQQHTWTDFVLQKLPRIYFHINSQQAINEQVPLTIQLCCCRSAYQEILRHLPEWPHVAYQHVDLAQAIDCDLYWLTLFRNKVPKQSIHVPMYTRLYLQQKRRKYLSYFAYLSSVALFCFSIQQYLMWCVVQEKLQTMQQQPMPIVELASSPLPINDLLWLANTERVFQQRNDHPDGLLFALSQALDVSPHIELVKIEWQHPLFPKEQGSELKVQAKLIGVQRQYRSAQQYLEQFRVQLKQQGFQERLFESPLQHPQLLSNLDELPFQLVLKR